MKKIEEIYTETDDRIGEIADKLNEVIRAINKLNSPKEQE